MKTHVSPSTGGGLVQVSTAQVQLAGLARWFAASGCGLGLDGGGAVPAGAAGLDRGAVGVDGQGAGGGACSGRGVQYLMDWPGNFNA